MYTIRPYSEQDFDVVTSWWETPAPTKAMYPLETSFILEVNDKPAICISVLLTNCKEVAYLENFIADPTFKNRKAATQALLDVAISFIESQGYKNAVGLCHEPKLVDRYIEMGFTSVYPDRFVLSKEVG